MRLIYLFLATLGGLAALVLVVAMAIPVYLASGPATVSEPIDFERNEGWLVRPPVSPEAVWEGGWALDVFVIPPMVDTLDRHGIISLMDHARAADNLPVDAAILDQLAGVGAIYMPALRVPTQATAEPDWEPARSDLAGALRYYAVNDNRGRALAIYAAGGSQALIADLPSILEEAAAERLSDRVVLILLPQDHSDASGLLTAFPNARLLDLQLDLAPRSWRQRMALPSPAPTWRLPADVAPLTQALEDASSAALARATLNAPKAAEPLGPIENVREAPVNRPCEAGLRCRRD